jgi:hypothetical protein
MIHTHWFSRIDCLWHWDWLSTAAWGAMAHFKGILVVACVGTGIAIGYGTLPPRVEAPPVIISAQPGSGNVPVDVPEPPMGLVFVGAVAVLITMKRKSNPA